LKYKLYIVTPSW